MTEGQEELAQAWEELSFWREFARWWYCQHGVDAEPRIIEAIVQAEYRYVAAGGYMSQVRPGAGN